MNIPRPISPRFAEMDPADYPPPPNPLPMFDEATYCAGKFCKLSGRIIPDSVQRTVITLHNGSTKTFCQWCLTALNQPERGSTLFGNNTMYKQLFRVPEWVEEMRNEYHDTKNGAGL